MKYFHDMVDHIHQKSIWRHEISVGVKLPRLLSRRGVGLRPRDRPAPRQHPREFDTNNAHTIMFDPLSKHYFFAYSWSRNRNIPGKRGQFHGCWFPALLHHVINSFGIHCVGWTGPGLLSLHISVDRLNSNYITSLWLLTDKSTGLVYTCFIEDDSFCWRL